MVLGAIEVALEFFLLLFPEHLRTFAGMQELLVVRLQLFDDIAVLLGTHLRQLRGDGEETGQARVTERSANRRRTDFFFARIPIR